MKYGMKYRRKYGMKYRRDIKENIEDS